MPDAKEPTDDILSATKVSHSGGEVTELTPTQQAGMFLAKGVGVTVMIVIAIILLDWFRYRPSAPNLPSDAVAAKSALENYKADG